MLVVMNFFQAIGFFGFGNWLPALLSGKGASVTHSLLYAFFITLAYPLGSLLCSFYADKMENKWQIVLSCLVTVIFGSLFALQNNPLWLILCGFFITWSNAWLTYSYHSYQSGSSRPTSAPAPSVSATPSAGCRRCSAASLSALSCSTAARWGDRVYRRQHADRDAGDRAVRPENARHRSGKHLTFCAGGDAGLFSKNSRSCENYSVITAFAPAVLLPGTKSNSIPSGEHVMSILTAPDGARISTRIGAAASRSCSPTVGRCPPTPGTTSCCFRPERVPGDRPRSPRPRPFGSDLAR